MSDGVMTYEDWLRGCVYHDGRHGYVTLPCDEVLRVADFIERLRHSHHIQDVASVGCVGADRKTENSSEKPNNCEHITEDGVTCAKYLACDDCLDNPLNKVKGSERLLKGKDEPQTCDTCKYGEDKHRYAHICNECGVGINNYEPKDEPLTCSVNGRPYSECTDCEYFKCTADEPQTEQKWTCARCGCENHADFIWCFKCGYHKTERKDK